MPLTSNPLLVPPVLPTASPAGIKPSGTIGTIPSINNQGTPSPVPSVPHCNIFWVKNIDEVLAHPTSPNEHLYFGSEDDAIIYVRETDANGQIKSPVKVLHYTIEDMPIGPEAQFVTKDEHKQLYSLVEQLSHNIESMNGKLEKLLNG